MMRELPHHFFGVFVIGTTYWLDMIDSVLTRARRLGETIEIPPPDGGARINILQEQLDSGPVDLDSIIGGDLSVASESDEEKMPYVASDVAKIADEAAGLTVTVGGPNDIRPVTQAHLKGAIDA
jgi:SpoVK/Ycf46/Vps4 family AAA+-type ATPase